MTPSVWSRLSSESEEELTVPKEGETSPLDRVVTFTTRVDYRIATYQTWEAFVADFELIASGARLRPENSDLILEYGPKGHPEVQRP